MKTRASIPKACPMSSSMVVPLLLAVALRVHTRGIYCSITADFRLST
jgi:hypothetical protein